MQQFISVILLTYNRKNLLQRQLESVLKQSFRDYELILINNGSSDGTDELCKKYVERDKRIRLFSFEENKGTAYARNFGLEQVRTEYILFIDDDDYCESEMFSHLYRIISENNADIAITGCVDEYADGTIVPKYVYEEFYQWNKEEGVSEFLKREKFHTAPGTKLFRTSLFNNVRFIVGVKIDDIHVIYKLFVAAKKVVAQGKPYLRFYKHSGNETGFLSGDVLKSDILNDYLCMQDERVAYITEQLPSLTRQVCYAKYSYMISMIEKIELGFAIECDEQMKRMKAILKEHKEEFLNAEWVTDREINLFKKYID